MFFSKRLTSLRCRQPRASISILLLLLTPQQTWSHISGDIIRDLYAFRGNIKTIVFLCLIVLPRLTFQHILGVMGSQRTQLLSSVWRKAGNLDQFKIPPQSNGRIKQTNQYVGLNQKTFCLENQTYWMQLHPWSEFIQNSPFASVSQCTQYCCFCGTPRPCTNTKGTQLMFVCREDQEF